MSSRAYSFSFLYNLLGQYINAGLSLLFFYVNFWGRISMPFLLIFFSTVIFVVVLICLVLMLVEQVFLLLEFEHKLYQSIG